MRGDVPQLANPQSGDGVERAGVTPFERLE
jgi:hypothetical protein